MQRLHNQFDIKIDPKNEQKSSLSTSSRRVGPFGCVHSRNSTRNPEIGLVSIFRTPKKENFNRKRRKSRIHCNRTLGT